MDDGARLWVNGKEVFTTRETKAAAPEQHKVAVKLAKGKNAVLLKVANGNNPHGFYFSLTSAEETKACGSELRQFNGCPVEEPHTPSVTRNPLAAPEYAGGLNRLASRLITAFSPESSCGLQHRLAPNVGPKCEIIEVQAATRPSLSASAKRTLRRDDSSSASPEPG